MSKSNQRENFVTALTKTSKDRFKMLFDFAPVPLVEGVWSTDFKVINVNQAALDLFACQDRKQFDQWFSLFPSKIDKKILFEMLSARVRGDFYETQ